MPNLSKISHPTGILWVLMLLSFMQWFCFTLNQVSNHVSAVNDWQPPSDPYMKMSVDIFKPDRRRCWGVFFFPFFLEITNVNLWQEGHFMKPLSWIQQLLMLIVVFKIQSSGISFKWSMQCNKGSFIGRFSDLSVIYKDISAIVSRFLHSHFILSPPSSSRAAHLWVRHANTVTDCINWMEVCPMFLTSTVYDLLTVLVIY